MLDEIRLFASVFLNVLICIINKMAVKAVARKSETGRDPHTPSNPKSSGSINNAGSSNKNWRDKLRNIAFPAIPIHWKKFVTTIWKPTKGNIRVTIRNPLADSEARAGDGLNGSTTISGKSSPIASPIQPITMPTFMV